MSFSTESILARLHRDPHYLGSNNIASRCTWTAAPDGQSEILIATAAANAPAAAVNSPTTDITPVVLTMVVQLLPLKFYLKPDGPYNPDNIMPWQASSILSSLPAENLVNGLASVLLGAAPMSHPQLHAEWARYLPAIDAVLQKCLPFMKKTGFCTREDTRTMLKLVHGFFEPRLAETIPELPQATSATTDTPNNTESGTSSTAPQVGQIGSNLTLAELEALDDDRDPQFRTVNVPTHPLNRPALLEVARTHQFNPLCAFMHGNRDTPIAPALYETVLPGALVLVSFTLSHRLMRRPANSSHFTATINEIEVLERPSKISMSPLKARNQHMFRKRKPEDDQAEGSSTAGKKRARVA